MSDYLSIRKEFQLVPFRGKDPVPGTFAMPVFSDNPCFGFVRVPPLSPSPEHIPHPVIQIAEYIRRYD